jgi:hypothetical protein
MVAGEDRALVGGDHAAPQGIRQRQDLEAGPLGSVVEDGLGGERLHALVAPGVDDPSRQLLEGGDEVAAEPESGVGVLPVAVDARDALVVEMDDPDPIVGPDLRAIAQDQGRARMAADLDAEDRSHLRIGIVEPMKPAVRGIGTAENEPQHGALSVTRPLELGQGME